MIDSDKEPYFLLFLFTEALKRLYFAVFDNI